ncbi:hypothetical protein BSL82_09455 [Tardibacter chloracetimidivorans]|uniref:Uncharacterized protein n=1 Tax=Tardibacter chloracetimidivorans TaxID=1921510 RepID=A0A1L3ZV23_9SPHN|nr:glycosyl hydrolase 108 family protein [Tardibacter chloracetimidivorans]API59506.1 hypothetical protein BSL82_09455 [Tardibacter chloracetimidivorans]
MSKARLVGAAATALTSILGAIFAVEGGYVNNPLDPGGETHHGVTKKVAVESGYTGPMRDLTKEKAAAIYASRYIEKPGFLPLVERDRWVAEETIDSGVNFGPYRPSCWLQQTLNHLNDRQRDYPDVVVDCKIGPATLAAFDALRKRRGDALACELVVKLMDAKAAGEYMRLAGTNANSEAFMVGWTRTRLGNVDFRQCR